MAEFDVVIRGGMVVDGTRLPRYQADVGIKDDPVSVLNVECGNYAYSFIRLAPDRGLVIYQGHFFGVAKPATR